MSSITVSPVLSGSAQRGSAQRGSAQRGSGSGQLRLTRRGRVAVLGSALLFIGGLALGLGPSVVASGERGGDAEMTVVTVQPGQTIWQIAAEANPGGDPRETVDDIMRMNSLASAGGLQMGEELAVPIYE